MQQFLEETTAKEHIHQDYQSLHEWSVKQPVKFWQKLIEFYKIKVSGDFDHSQDPTAFDGYHWFPNLKLNFAKNLLNTNHPDNIALKSIVEGEVLRELTYSQLRSEVGKFQNFLKEYIGEGDVLACYMPNICETVVSMLATTSMGSVFTSTSTVGFPRESKISSALTLTIFDISYSSLLYSSN